MTPLYTYSKSAIVLEHIRKCARYLYDYMNKSSKLSTSTICWLSIWNYEKKLFVGYQFAGYQFVDFGYQFVGYQFDGYQFVGYQFVESWSGYQFVGYQFVGYQ